MNVLRLLPMVITVSALLCPLVFSSTESPITWEQCLSEAKARHPKLLAAAAAVRSAKSQASLVNSSSLPAITSFASGQGLKTNGARRADTFSYGIEGKQLLFDGMSAQSDSKAALKLWDAARYEYEVTASEIRLALSQAYSNLGFFQEYLTMVEGIAQRRKENLDMVRLQYEGGREHKGSLLTAMANWEKAQADIAYAKRHVVLAQRQLMVAMGRNDMQGEISAVWDKDSPSQGDQPDFEGIVDGVPLLKALVSKKEAARLGVASAKSAFFPTVYATGVVKNSEDQWLPAKSSWSVGLSVTMPLFEGGHQQAKLAKAKADYDQAEANAYSGKDQVIQTLLDAWTNWQDGVDEEHVSEQFLQAALERVNIASVQYGSGLVSFNEWIIIEDALVNAKKNALVAKRSARFANAQWEQAKGVTLDE